LVNVTFGNVFGIGFKQARDWRISTSAAMVKHAICMCSRGLLLSVHTPAAPHLWRPARCSALYLCSRTRTTTTSFGGLSPERKASQALESLLTFAAAKCAALGVSVSVCGCAWAWLGLHTAPQQHTRLGTAPCRAVHAHQHDTHACAHVARHATHTPNRAHRIVLAQLEGSGRGALGAYNATQHAVLSAQLSDVSLRDADAWLADLMRKDKGTGALKCAGGARACVCVCVCGCSGCALRSSTPV
jgi:hypothetical protein